MAVIDVVDITDPADARVDDFRDLNSVDRRPDLPTGKGLVIAEGVLVVQRMVASRFAPHAFLGTDRRLAELGPGLAEVTAPFYRASAEVMAEVIGFHLNRGVLAAARGTRIGLADNWLRHVQDVRLRHRQRLNHLPQAQLEDAMCEMNVIQQVGNVAMSNVMQDAWGRGQKVAVHGWIYGISDGLVKNLEVTMSGSHEVGDIFRKAFKRYPIGG